MATATKACLSLKPWAIAFDSLGREKRIRILLRYLQLKGMEVGGWKHMLMVLNNHFSRKGIESSSCNTLRKLLA